MLQDTHSILSGFSLADAKTALDKMNLTDQFLFNAVTEDKETYKTILEILLDKDLSLLSTTESEKELGISPELRKVRLDIIGIDHDGKIYHTEMQKKNTFNLIRRSRYYQGQIDVSLLPPGSVDFNRLKDVTVILIAPFDIFGYGLYRYTFQGHCQEVPQFRINDGAKRIFINTKGTNHEDVSQEFIDFMHYINSSTDEVAAQSSSHRIKRIHEQICTIRTSEKMGVKFMQAWEERILNRQEGRAEGRGDGIREILVQLVCRKLQMQDAPETIANALGVSFPAIRTISNAVNVCGSYDTNVICNYMIEHNISIPSI